MMNGKKQLVKTLIFLFNTSLINLDCESGDVEMKTASISVFERILSESVLVLIENNSSASLHFSSILSNPTMFTSLKLDWISLILLLPIEPRPITATFILSH